MLVLIYFLLVINISQICLIIDFYFPFQHHFQETAIMPHSKIGARMVVQHSPQRKINIACSNFTVTFISTMVVSIVSVIALESLAKIA